MESEFISWLRDRLPPHPQLRLGIGDDAALLALAADADCVVTSDMLSDGVDFLLDRCDRRLVGRKALAVNLSDLAAMAARPVAAIVSLMLPREGVGDVDARQLAIELYDGLLPLAGEFNIAIAGGDTNTWSGRLVIGVTAIGESTARGSLRRDGARPDDAIVVTGQFGGSILGRHFSFTPRVHEAIALHQRYDLHAGTDVSDGLSLDLANICQASGCGAELDAAAIPIAVAARQMTDAKTPLEHALSDGEDFELILAVDPAAAERMLVDNRVAVPLSRIGRFTTEPGLFIVDATGRREPLNPAGYRH